MKTELIFLSIVKIFRQLHVNIKRQSGQSKYLAILCARLQTARTYSSCRRSEADVTKIAISSIQCMRKIEPGAPVWKKFNASFKNADCTTSEIMDAIYEGYPVTTQLKEPWRTSENYLMGQHLALDFDTEDKTSTIDYLVKDKFIDKYGTFVHTTISHSPEAPRARVFFLLDQPIHQAKNYTLAASALLWLFGAADRQCKDAAR